MPVPSRHDGAIGEILVVAQAALRLGLRDQTFRLLAVVFLTLVLVSAYLGWSATTTANEVYERAAAFLSSQGKPVAPNPIVRLAPLGLLRNLATYVPLLGALAGIVLGHQVVAVDRKAGVLPLLASRPIRRMVLASGKIVGVAVGIAALLALSGILSAVTMMAVPGEPLGALGWVQLVTFFVVSTLYVVVFALLGMLFAALCRSQSAALLVPVALWLGLTFVVPQLTTNVNPMAALNPLSATAQAPPGAFFAVTGAILTPISVAEAYRVLAAGLLGFAPAGPGRLTLVGASATLVLVLAGAIAGAAVALRRLDASRGDYAD
jgi:ABC-type transport system involved in multi-copper enzyme maturation permease subunit